MTLLSFGCRLYRQRGDTSEITGLFFTQKLLCVSPVIGLNGRSNCTQTCAFIFEWSHLEIGRKTTDCSINNTIEQLTGGRVCLLPLFMCALFQSQCHSLFSSEHSSRGLLRNLASSNFPFLPFNGEQAEKHC